MTIEQIHEIYLENPIICTDSRKVTSGVLFFALKGERFDANAFAPQALAMGAAYAVVDDARFEGQQGFIVVADVLQTLQELARFHRSKLSIPIIGITGTNGKTTTKELIKSVLSQRFRTYATEGNLNNHIGVPLSVLAVGGEFEVAVIEMGANHQEEIAFLCSIARPGFGLITNVGKAHLEGFGGVEGVRKAKGELYEFLAGNGGTVFINGDNPTLMEMANMRKVSKMVAYGSEPGHFVRVTAIPGSGMLEVAWRLADSPTFNVASNLSGVYNLENIAAAICIGAHFGLSSEEINRGIAAYVPTNSRSQILQTSRNRVICDYYNANPSSMTVALDNLAMQQASDRVMILGDMFELGQDAAMEHEAVLRKALEVPALRRVFVGSEFYRLNGTPGAEFYKTTNEAAESLSRSPVSGATVLLKGSRGMKLESLLPYL